MSDGLSLLPMWYLLLSFLLLARARHTTSFIENSTEAGILLGGNGTLHAMMAAFSRAFRMQPSVTKVR